jgi:hypothetical protein
MINKYKAIVSSLMSKSVVSGRCNRHLVLVKAPGAQTHIVAQRVPGWWIGEPS